MSSMASISRCVRACGEKPGQDSASSSSHPRAARRHALSREAESPMATQHPLQPSHAAGPLDGAQQAALVGALGDTQAREVGPQDAQQRQDDPEHRAQPADPSLQAHDPCVEGSGRLLQQRIRDDLAAVLAHPSACRGSRDAASRGEFDVAGALDELHEAVVVGPLAAG